MKYLNFDGIGSLIHYTTTTKSILRDEERDSRIVDNHRDKFTQTKNFEEAVNLATHGWPKGRKWLFELTKQYQDIFKDRFPTQDHSHNIIFDVSGEEPDIGAYCSGVPEHMFSFQPSDKITTGNVLQKIIVGGTYYCGINEQTVYSYGAMLLSLVKAMEDYGFRLELSIRFTILGRDQNLMIFDILLKSFEDDYNYDKLAFALAHPGFFRRLIFSVMETYDKQTLRTFSVPRSYGRPYNYFEDINKDSTMIFKNIEDNLSVDEMMKRFFEPQLNKFYEANRNTI